MVCYNRKTKRKMEKTMRPNIFLWIWMERFQIRKRESQSGGTCTFVLWNQVENLDTLEKFIGPPLWFFLGFLWIFRGTEPGGSRKIEYFSRQVFENVLYDEWRIACGSYFTGKKIVIDIKTGSIYCTDPPSILKLSNIFILLQKYIRRQQK